MTLIVGLDGAPLESNAFKSRVYGATGPQFTAAADGTGSQGQIVFDDPTGTRIVRGYQIVTAEEDDCPQPRLFTGTIGERTERRGNYRHGSGREIDATINDQNIFLAFRNMGGADCVRPAETDIERLAWLTSSPYLSGLVADTGWVNGTGLPFPKASYKGKFAQDVLSDLAGPYGQTYFAAWDPNNQQIGLFFDFPDAVVNTSTLTISNVLADVDENVCFAPMTDGELTIDPTEVISHLRYVFANGVYYANNATTAAMFFPSPLISKGEEIENDRVGNLSTAITFANRILARRSYESAVLAFSVRLPSTHVGLIAAGQRIWVRMSHLTGFQSGAWTRVERSAIVQTDGNPLSYDVSLTLSTRGLARIGGGGDPGDFPFPPPSAGPPELLAEKGAFTNIIFDDAFVPPDGALIVLFQTARIAGTPSTPAGFTVLHNTATSYGLDVSYRIASGEVGSVTSPFGMAISGTGGASSNMYAYVFAAGTTVGQVVYRDTVGSSSPVDCGGPITPAQAYTRIIGGTVNDNFFGASVVPASGLTTVRNHTDPTGNPPGLWVASKEVATPIATSISGTLTSAASWHGVTIEILGGLSTDPPEPAQPVNGESVTLVGLDGTTAHPYAAGSLRVKFMGVDMTPGVDFIETDPSCGDFSFTFDPGPAPEVVVWYQGA